MLIEHKQHLLNLLHRIVEPMLADKGQAISIMLERPKEASHGDAASNIAMQLAKTLKKNPRELASLIVAELLAQPDAILEHAEVAEPGFINMHITLAAKQSVVCRVLTEKACFGSSTKGRDTAIILEFVSANPTGPLHVGHGRQAALGDTLAALMVSQGYRVTKEFYYNDAGAQIAHLALSVQARLKGLSPGDAGWPESAYNGEYISDIAKDYLAKKTVFSHDGEVVRSIEPSGDINDLEAIRQFSVCYLRGEQDRDLQAFGVVFDHYFLESSLYTNGQVAETVASLQKRGQTYGEGGALWLRTTDYGDDKDRVMQKQDGTYTYFVPDVAYHVTKWQRGFTKAINIQGSDHHGTIARVRAGLAALDMGIPPGYPDYILHKMVTVVKDGREVKISKRAGTYVTLRDLIEWSGDGDIQKGRDAVRFFLASRKPDTEFVFDVDMALAHSEENPVYYVQYAHARICSILEKVEKKEVDDIRDAYHTVDFTPLVSEREKCLLSKLAEYPHMLIHALDELAPHQVTFYLRELAAELHAYYNAERILVDDTQLKLARIALLLATQQVIQNGLAILGVSAPEKM